MSYGSRRHSGREAMRNDGRRATAWGLVLIVTAIAGGSAVADSGPFDAWSGTGGSPFAVSAAPEKLVVETSLIAPDAEAGTRAVLAVTVRLPEKSYIYATTSGGALPTEITVKGSPGLRALDERFRPDRKPVREYEAVLETTIEKFYGEVTWTLPFEITGDGSPSVAGELTGAYCSSGDRGFCTPIRPPMTVTATLELTDGPLPVRAVAETSESKPSLAADGSMTGVPSLPPAGETAAVEAAPEFDFGDDAFAFDAPAAGDLELPGDLNLPGEVAAGPLDLDDPFADERPASESLGKSVAVSNADDTETGSLAGYLVLAFLGGLILNVMPCVLPVVAIKAMSFVKQAGESRGRLLLLNLVYTFGVVSVFLFFASLAALPDLTAPLVRLIGLSGGSFSWGILFQSLMFNIAMAVVVFAMGLSLLGVFEIPLPGFVGSAAGSSSRDGLTGAFLTGVFATLLGTPCTGPFMTATLTWAVSRPAEITFLVLGTMGLGMASPYLVFGFVPGAVKLLPKPGDWMVTFKQISGFLLIGTTVFILNSIEGDLLIPVLTLLTGVAFGVWIYGQTQMQPELMRRRFGLAGGLVAAGIGGYLGFIQTAEADVDWQEFDGIVVERVISEGRTVLIDFTADWCANCKRNEANALDTPPTAAFLDRHDVAAFQADYTRESPEIRDWLDRYGSISVPLTVILPGGRPEDAIVLDGLFSQATLLENLERAVGPGPAVASLTE